MTQVKLVARTDGKGKSCSEVDTKVETDTEKKEGAGTEAVQKGESNTIELEKSGLSHDTEKRVQGLRWPRQVKVMPSNWRKVV